MKRINAIKFVFVLLAGSFSILCLVGCIFGPDRFPIAYENKFSIENNTFSNLSVILEVGIIPNTTARFDELIPIPDEVYKLCAANWSSTLNAQCTIRPWTHDKVHNRLPITGLGTPDDESESQNRLREELLGKLVSFIFTIKRGDTVVYRVVGWDIPEEDMAVHNIDDKLFGYYDTTEENYFNERGIEYELPAFTSKLFSDGMRTDWGSHICYYVKVTSNSVYLVEMNTDQTISDDDYWLEH